MFTVSKDCVDNLLTGFGYFYSSQHWLSILFRNVGGDCRPSTARRRSQPANPLFMMTTGRVHKNVPQVTAHGKEVTGMAGGGRQQLADREIRVGRSASCHSSDKRQAGNARRSSSSASDNTSRLTLWRPLLPYGYSYKASCARPG